ncbi:hypothetical protein HZC31_01055 [Candidatus Woesearchaeota archaeon]|nr:hypothetical protein [Candidatus Woesearchaeota archaeon]
MIDEDIKKLIIARLEVLPSDKKISIGSIGEFTKEQLIESVKREDAIGRKMIQIELEFLQALKEGIVTT